VEIIDRSHENPKRRRKKNLNRQNQPNFHEVEGFGDDFVDFGAFLGSNGQFSWHADFPVNLPD
jgi:hypothetical protein